MSQPPSIPDRFRAMALVAALLRLRLALLWERASVGVPLDVAKVDELQSHLDKAMALAETLCLPGGESSHD